MSATSYSHCPRCRPQEWPETDVVAHARCAADDEDRVYGTVVVSHPPISGNHTRYISRKWPVCPECGQEYCTWCGAEAWYQCL